MSFENVILPNAYLYETFCLKINWSLDTALYVIIIRMIHIIHEIVRHFFPAGYLFNTSMRSISRSLKGTVMQII